MSAVVVQKDGQLPELKIDKRTLDKTVKPPNVKHLRFSRKLPIKCDDCPYRPKDAIGSGQNMGNGICTAYKEGSLCTIRSDIRKAVERYGTRNPGKLLPLLHEEFEANYEKLKFFEAIENMSGQLDPEVTRRISVLNTLAKTARELEVSKQTVEIEQTQTLTNDKKDEIAKEVTRIIRMTQEVPRIENQ